MTDAAVQAVHDGLAEVLTPVLGSVQITGLHRLSAGANRETWSFDATDTAGVTHALILQRDRDGMERLVGSCAREARVLRHARAGGVPCAEVVVSADAPNPLVRSFTVNRRLEGETIARRILRDPQWAGARAAFVADCARALGAIHRLDTAPLTEILPDTGDPLDLIAATYELLEDPHPSFDLALRWLRRHRPEPLGPCLVHGDFRLGNLLLDQHGLAAALDWEICHLGDPGEDLGWLCVRAWRFGGAGAVGGIGSHQELMDAYEAATGVAVGHERLHWWEVYGTLRWGVICMQLTDDHRSGRSPSVELATIGRRVAENEYDVLLALAGGTWPDPVPPTVAGVPPGRPLRTNHPHDVPDARELVDAVRGYLADDLQARAEGRDKWLVRIAANALAIAERELRLGPGHAAAHVTRLDALGVTSDQELCAAIGHGDLDDRWDDLSASCRATVMDKLAVANPGYVTDRSASS